MMHNRSKEKTTLGEIRSAIKFGAFLLIAAPFVWYLVQYRIAVGSFDGLIEQLPYAMLESAVDFFNWLIREPV